MGIVYQTDKRSGITYAYENQSFWDPELKRSRSKRKLIGRVDKDTGEILPFNTFCSKYAIFDFGENHYAEKIGQGTNLHDNFVVSNMTPEGYEKMVRVLSEIH